MRVFLTGASGFVGSHLLARFLRTGEHAVAVVLRPGRPHRRIEHLLDRVEVLAGDLAQPEALAEPVQRFAPELVLHAAWANPNSENRDSAQHADHVTHALELVKLAHAAGVRHFVGIGSQAEYGTAAVRADESEPAQPVTFYGVAKLCAGLLSGKLCATFGIRFAWLRLFAAYGPGEDDNWLIPSVGRALLAGQRPATTEGKQRWDYLFVEDVAEAVATALESVKSSIPPGSRVCLAVGSQRLYERVRMPIPTMTHIWFLDTSDHESLIAQEISTFDFHNVDEDILKGVYQELIDLDTRHALGEYYTPDWLCERIVNEFQFKETDKILDPACGSGSFLLAVIHKFKKIHPELPVAELNNRIYGIDIHPLSVQIAKTTILLALGKEIAHSKKPVHLNIILANTLLAPDGVKDLFGETFRMLIDKETLILNSQVLEDVALFDEALETCDELADQTMNKKKATAQAFETILKNRHKKGEFNPQIIESFYKIYESLRSVKEKGRDSIWKFIVQNLYKPYFLSAKFDYVIGNPPWFTYNSIKNEEYQDIVNQLAEKYSVKPAKVANFPHLEIAAIFLAYCSAYFLKEEGRIAFVLPRSFFSADHHDNSRSGKAEGYRLTSIWDLNDVSPLFRIPSCVLFAQKAGVKTTASGLQYEVIKMGAGPKPTAQSTVKVDYVGTLIDGTEFDSSIKRKAPATFPVSGVIPGWTEALQLMPVGSKFKLVLPASIAYGAAGAGEVIKPFSTLIFEVELLEIVK